MEGEKKAKMGGNVRRNGKKVLRRAGENSRMDKRRTTQSRVYVPENLTAAVQRFLNGIPVQVQSSLLPLSFLYSAVEVWFALLFYSNT